jgi:hypothetical protein
LDLTRSTKVNFLLKTDDEGSYLLRLTSSKNTQDYSFENGKVLRLRKNFDQTIYSLSIIGQKTNYTLTIKKNLTENTRTYFQIFNGSIESRIYNPVNGKQNTRLHRINLTEALTAKFTLSWTGNGDLELSVYTKESNFNNFNDKISPIVNNFFGLNSQRLLGQPIGNNQLQAIFDITNFTPTEYIPQIINLQSDEQITYQLRVEYTEPICKIVESNPFVGFWEFTNRNESFNYKFLSTSDGNLKLQTFSANNFTNFSQDSIFSSPLTKINNGYMLYTGIERDVSRYYYLNSQNQNQMLSVIGGNANPVANESLFSIFNRLENPNILNVLDSQIPSTPIYYLEDFFQTNFLAGNPQYARDVKSTDYPGIDEMTRIKNQILSKGIIEEFEGTDIWPEMTHFGSSYSTEGIENPIKTYDSITLHNILFTAQSVTSGSFFDRGNQISFRMPKSDYEIGMLIDVSGMKGQAKYGLADEWMNDLYRIISLIEIEEDPGYQFITLVQTNKSDQIIPWVNTPAYLQPIIHLKPRCFRVSCQRINEILLTTSTSFNPSIVELQGFWEVGGINTRDLNNRFTIYSQFQNQILFLITNENISSTSAIGGRSGIVKVCTYPNIRANAGLINNLASTMPPTPPTLFFTSEPLLTSASSRIRISGLAGDYKILNNIDEDIYFTHHQNYRTFNSNITKEIWKEGYYLPDRKHYLLINVKSEGLPSFNPAIHTINGKSFKIERIIEKYTNESTYGEFTDICSYLFKKAGVNTHNGLIFYFDAKEGNPNPSWQVVQNSVTNATTILRTDTLYRNRGFDPSGALAYYPKDFTTSAFFQSALLNNLNKSCYGGVRGNTIDVSKRIDITAAGIFLTSRLYLRYLIEDQINNIYALISGKTLNERVPGSDPNNENISNFLTDFGYNANGTIIDYVTLPQPFINSGSILFNLRRPESTEFIRYDLRNAFSPSGFVQKEIEGEVILANPPNAASSLINAEDCRGKIVFCVQIPGESLLTFQNKYNNIVAAGAKTAVIVTTIPSNNFVFTSITISPQNDIMLYAASSVIGNQIIGYTSGNRLDPNNYQLPVVAPTDYFGKFAFAPTLVGAGNFILGVVKPEFSNEKNIGYLFLFNTTPVTPEVLELNSVFRDNYNTDTTIDQFAKMAAAIMKTTFNIGDKTLTFAQMDTIIIDNGSNTGGFIDFLIAFSSFFGDDRPSLVSNYSRNGTGYTPSLTGEQVNNQFPGNINLNVWNYPEEIPCRKYQLLYPDATFKGKKVVILSSTTSFSAGDVAPHYFRNSRSKNPGDLGNGVTSIIVGNIDGRIQGTAGFFYSNPPAVTSNFSVGGSVYGQTTSDVIYAMRTESNDGLFNSYTQENAASQLPEIKVEGLNNEGPLRAWVDDSAGYYENFGFYDVFSRDIPRYKIFNDVLGFPVAYQDTTYRVPYLEDSILEAGNE